MLRIRWPSLAGSGSWRSAVTDADAQASRCTCPDFELRGEPCKHIQAVRIVIQQSFSFDGETVTLRPQTPGIACCRPSRYFRAHDASLS